MNNLGFSAICMCASLVVSCSNLTLRPDTLPIETPATSGTGGEPLSILVAPTDTTSMAEVKGGSYVPFYGKADSSVVVKGFQMDIHPVTNRQFLAFVRLNPQWRRSAIKRIYADGNYLAGWQNDSTLGYGMLEDAPVTNVSWFAAKAYCNAIGKTLPTVNQWEYAAMADETTRDARTRTSYNQHILSWYEKPNTSGLSVGLTTPNYWGIMDLHGLVWEWTEDFSEVMLSGESRRDVSTDNSMFCGSGSVGASDLMNYAAFMRFAFRGSLKANYCVQNQGFRCVSK